MADDTPNLALPYILAAQSQKHVTHNEGLRLLDALVQLAVLDRHRTAPPASPAEGDRHLVAASATGAWAGWDGSIASFIDGAWLRLTPKAGWLVHVLDAGLTLIHDGSTWTSGPAMFGVNATPDATNRFAVASAASLFTNAGAGHQLKINKAAAGDTASLLYQTNWSGRAEMGTSGSDDFAIKVSADGLAWNTALNAEAASGIVTLGKGARLSDGNAGAPGLAFDADTDTGLWRIGADILGLASGGAERVRVTTAGMQVTGLITGTAITQSATDTTSGRLLKVGDFGLRDSTIDVSDFDALTVTGFYRNNAAATGAPESGTLYWNVLHIGHDAGQTAATQIATRAAGTAKNRMYIRRKSSSVWSAWSAVYHQDSVVGAVSQASGVPTGALIEKGSNANGHYTRWADGTQQCWVTLAASSGAAKTWTFPAAFSAAPVVTGTAQATVLSSVCLDAAPTTTAATFSARDNANARRADTCHLFATGRWF